MEDWAATDAAYLRRFYPPGDDEVHYEVTPAFEKAYAWVMTLQGRSFVGTESRLHTVVELLRQIVHGTEVEPDVRLAELRRRRDELDAEIATVEDGIVTVMDATGVRDRYQQLSATARELLSDFREVEENFRLLDPADATTADMPCNGSRSAADRSAATGCPSAPWCPRSRKPGRRWA